MNAKELKKKAKKIKENERGGGKKINQDDELF